MRYGLPGKDPTEVLAYMRKRMPGRKPIEDLDRIALLLEDEDNMEDAAILHKLAERLRELRAAARGPGRTEHAQEATRKAISEALAAGLGEPFDSEKPIVTIMWEWKEGRKRLRLETPGKIDYCGSEKGYIGCSVPEEINLEKAKEVFYQARIEYRDGYKFFTEIKEWQ